MKALQRKATEFRLPEITTPENLEAAFFTDSAVFLNYGSRFLMAGYFFRGCGESSYYAAIYEFVGKKHTCEDEIRLTEISEGFFPDNGSAIAWAINH